MSFSEVIRHAQQDVWPGVRASLIRVRNSRDLVNANPGGATTAALARSRKNWDRVVADETVWAIAKQGWLATSEQADVVTAAQSWVSTWDEDALSTMDAEERRLYDAVQALAGSLREMSDVG